MSIERIYEHLIKYPTSEGTPLGHFFFESQTSNYLKPFMMAALQEATQELPETEKDVAVGQAATFAAYVESRAKGTMRDAAKEYLSLPYAQKIAERLASAPDITQPRPKLEGFNQLPQQVRDYIMWIETEADPAGTIRENWRLTQENRALRVLLGQTVTTLQLSKAMCEKALPKFNWGASALDAEAIDILNRAPTAITEALQRLEE